jgi:hypothetical protein
MRAAATLACLWSMACASPANDPCAARVELLLGMESARVHGLTENDDVREAIQRVADAAACASPTQMELVTAQAQLLAHRLAVRGSSAELLTLARSMGTLPLADSLRHQVAATAAAEQRLRTHGEQLVVHEPGARSSMAAAAWGGPPVVPNVTTAFITHVTAQESCVVVVPGKDAPDGTVVFSVRRGGVDQALHGDAPAVTWAPSRKAAVRLCVADALLEGDELLGSNGVVRMVLHPSNDDVARGSALDALAGLGGVPAQCHGATGSDARLACAWMGGGTP